MSQTSFNPPRWLALLLILMDGEGHTASELTKLLDCEQRNFFYLLRSMPEKGIRIRQQRGLYYLEQDSELLTRIFQSRAFTIEEAACVYQEMLPKVETSELATAVVRKLERNYPLEKANISIKKAIYDDNLKMLKMAISSQCMCKLVGYTSLHSHKVKDRTVEPYLIINDKDVRAYVPHDKCCKSFRITRIKKVVVNDVLWSHANKHDTGFTDIFDYCGQPLHHVKARLGFDAHQLMAEEYPQSVLAMTPEDSRHWILEADLVSYDVIVRFVLGSYDNVEVLGDEGLKEHIAQRIERMK